jgi:hypothetical protein
VAALPAVPKFDPRGSFVPFATACYGDHSYTEIRLDFGTMNACVRHGGFVSGARNWWSRPQVLSLCIWILMSHCASARIGWTLQDCEEHFGSPINTDWSEGISAGRTFKHGDMTIEVSFESEKVSTIEYQLRRPFFVQEIIDLMQKNIEGRDVKWISTPEEYPVTDDKGKRIGDERIYSTTQDTDGFVIKCITLFYPKRSPKSVTFLLVKGTTSGL